MDTDVEVFKPLDEFLNEPAFTGFENVGFPVCATMGAEKGNPIIKEMLDYYNDRDFEIKTNTVIMSEILSEHGINREKNEIQKIDNFTVYPKEYFVDSKGYTEHHFKRELALMYETCICMKYKCKTCPKKIECDEKLKKERLTWRPFEELPRILKEKGVKIW